MNALSRDEVLDGLGGFRVLVCQLGAREHYLVARCFAKCGSLSLLATDFWSPVRPPRSGLFRRLPRIILSAMARRHDELGSRQVVSFPLLSAARYGIVLFGRKGAHDGAIARRFARSVQALKAPHNVFFGYSYDSLELLQLERKKGVFTILCQTDPGPAHYGIVVGEEIRWPEYGAGKGRSWTRQRTERLKEEWDLADVIIANSQWTRDAIVSEGADASKIEILPLAYETEDRGRRTEDGGQRAEEGRAVLRCFGGKEDGGQGTEVRGQRTVSSPLRVLWLGNVALGKGIQYLVEAARLLVNEPVEFTVAGSIQISADAVKAAPNNMHWLGQIPRSRTDELYSDCDIFVFPTLSDGFGLTQLEALANGVPVITTPNCGRVVEDQLTGFIIPPRDPKALADAILKFVRNRQLLEEMGASCLEAVRAFSMDAYGNRLVEVIGEHMAKRAKQGLRAIPKAGTPTP